MYLPQRQDLHHTQAQPLQALRTSTRLSAQIRHLPAVFPGIGAAGRDSGGFEVVLVIAIPPFENREGWGTRSFFASGSGAFCSGSGARTLGSGDFDAISSVSLGLIESLIRGLDDLVDVLRLRLAFRNPDADGHGEIPVVDRNSLSCILRLAS